MAGKRMGKKGHDPYSTQKRRYDQSRLSDEVWQRRREQCLGLVQIAHKLDLLLGGHDALVGENLQQILEYRLLFRGHSA